MGKEKGLNCMILSITDSSSLFGARVVLFG